MNPEKPNVTKKIDHSGNLPEGMREEPINDFDNTTLEQAVSQNLIDVPETTEAFDGWTPGQYTTEKKTEKNNKNLKLKIIGAVTAAAAGISLAAGLMLPKPADNANNTGSEPVETATSQPTPEATATTTPEAIPSTADILKQTESIESMEAMSVDEFAKLPFADRAAYAVAKADLSVMQPGTPEDDIALNDKSAITDWYFNNLMNAAYMQSGTEDGAKINTSGLYYTSGADDIDARYDSVVNNLLSAGKDGHYNTMYQYVKSGDPQTGIDRNGNPIDFVNVTSNIIDAGYNGATLDVLRTQTSQVVRSVVETLDGKDHVFYSIAYSVPGEGAPDVNYPY